VTDKLQIEQGMARLELYGQQLAEIDEEINRLSLTSRWQGEMRLLMQLPGSGPLTGMTILGAIGDISRFESAKKLVGYAGLGSSVHSSGGKTKTGAITKTGRKDLRRSLVQMARAAVRAHPLWQQQYDELCRRLPKQKAVVAIARKLLVAIWHNLTKQVADTQTSAERQATVLPSGIGACRSR
jgi:transposase